MAFGSKSKAPRVPRNPREPREPPKRPAKTYAVWLLSRRDYSAKELHGKLVTRGYSAEDADEALRLMQEHGFQDEDRYAGAKARTTGRRKGDRAVQQALVEKGVSRELAQAQVGALEPEGERAIALMGKFEGREVDAELQAKVWRFLAYRGFSGAAVKAALAHLKASAQEQADQAA